MSARAWQRRRDRKRGERLARTWAITSMQTHGTAWWLGGTWSGMFHDRLRARDHARRGYLTGILLEWHAQTPTSRPGYATRMVRSGFHLWARRAIP